MSVVNHSFLYKHTTSVWPILVKAQNLKAQRDHKGQ